MTAATFRRRPNFDQGPTYNHRNAITTPQLPYHTFSASRHHVAAQHVDMAGYEPSVNAQPSANMPDSGQRREDSYSPDDTPTKSSALHHSVPDKQHDFMNNNPATDAPYLGIQHTPAPPPLPATDDTSEGHYSMLPPPNSVHASWQALHEFAQSHASEHGYALSINTTAKNRSRIKLACVCYGQPKNTHKLTAETRVRKNRVSYKTGCKMWIEGKKQEDGTWLLRVGEPQHNHAGRESAGWAVQRKRTWGVVGGRIGVGGVTAKEELARLNLTDSLVWKIVEQEMLRRGETNQGRDRGVGRTVEVLQARLPGIHIFKRDVYNIRAQIKRARKAAGQQIGDGINSSDDEAEVQVEPHDATTPDEAPAPNPQPRPQQAEHTHRAPLPPSRLPQPPPPSIYQPTSLLATKTSAPKFTAPRQDPRIDPLLNDIPPTPAHSGMMVASEVEQLRLENAELRRLLTEKTKEVKEKTIEMASLRSQVELLSNMMMTSGRGLLAG
ncbi:FAR1 multi-domain protein [Pyrenophora tritici-repentis]|nr:FAR1 multi-domain protein [Pyrenophora tritici-repentis]KAI0611701.1 FAR1 multi-domain protein [Pyrenophora tritici-repentis]